MAVEVMRTIASDSFRICGSGTGSTRTSCLPYQQFAFIVDLLPGVLVGPGHRTARSHRLPAAASGGEGRVPAEPPAPDWKGPTPTVRPRRPAERTRAPRKSPSPG